MQAVKEKISDMKEMQKAKAEAKTAEKVEKEIAHEVRLAKEAEASRQMHLTKATEKAQREMAKRINEK